ncbi:MAG: hypothetical protein HY925_00225 [Elusimicrobia bacterium]|nr:hypothetical protein [Elusimicrobiota bacterium]
MRLSRRSLAAAILLAAAPVSAQQAVERARAALEQPPAVFWDGEASRPSLFGPVSAAPSYAPRAAVHAAAVPAIRRVVEVPRPPAAPRASGFGERHPTLAPLLAGLLDAFRQQFATVEGITQNLLWILISILLTALSGFGAIARIVASVASLAVTGWMLWPIFRQGYDAVKRLRKASDGSPERYGALFDLGVAGGTLLILALLTAAGWAIGKSSAGKRFVSGLDRVLETGASRLGLPSTPLAESPSGALSGILNNVNDPVGIGARGRGLASPHSGDAHPD